MAKKKQQQTKLSPEKFITEKVRSLEIGKCYITEDFETVGEGHIIITRQHKSGDISLSSFLVDKFCLGVKDSFYRLRMSSYEVEDFLSVIEDSVGLEEISYDEVHNLIYGAVEFAEEAGIKPDKSFSLTKYFLEEDDENIPLIEYEYGKNGMHFLVAHSNLEASKYLPTMKKHLGDNFKYVVHDFGVDDDMDEELDDYEEYYDYDEDLENEFLPMYGAYGPETEYTYKHPGYPKELHLEHPQVAKTLSGKTVPTAEEIDSLLALPYNSLRRDVENFLLYTIGRTCDGIPDDMFDAGIVNEVVNSIILLGEIGDDENSLDVVLETLRQSPDFFDYYFGDFINEVMAPTLYNIGRNRLDKWMSFIKEEGLYSFAKICVVSTIPYILEKQPERRGELIGWMRELICFATEKLPETKFVDGTLAGFIADGAVCLRAKELLPELKAMFDTCLVDESIVGDYKEVEKEINSSLPPSNDELFFDIHDRFEELRIY